MSNSQAGINKAHLSIYQLKFLMKPSKILSRCTGFFHIIASLCCQVEGKPPQSPLHRHEQEVNADPLSCKYVPSHHGRTVFQRDECWQAEMKLQRCVTYPVIIMDMFRNKRACGEEAGNIKQWVTDDSEA